MDISINKAFLLSLMFSLTTAGSGSVVAENTSSASRKNMPESLQRAFQSIHDSTLLPGAGLVVFETEEGLFFITSDGRYVIKGDLYDKWHEQDVRSIEGIKYLSDKTPIEKMGINVNELNSVAIGEGEKVITVFLDPISSSATDILNKIEKAGLKDSYKFQIIFLPQKRTKTLNSVQIYQAIEQMSEAEKIDRLLPLIMRGGQDQLEKILTNPKKMLSMTSPPKTLAKSLVAQKLLGVRVLPTLIVNSSGKTVQGVENIDLNQILL